MKTKTVRWKRLTQITVVSLLTVVLAAFIGGQVARSRLAGQYPAPGNIIKTTGYRLHVYCEGNGPVTILLEAGLNDFSLMWNRVQSLLSRHAKTCAYDRAGLGWSEPSNRPASIENAVEDLKMVLEKVGGNQSTILVGHSYGSLIIRLYAQRYPKNIKSVILIDPANEFMSERILGYEDLLLTISAQFRRLIPVSSLGLMAFATDRIPANHLEDNALAQYRAILASRSFFKGAAAESREMVPNLRYMQSVGQKKFPDIPVVIISRGKSELIPGLKEVSAQSLEQTWALMQTDLVTRLNAKQVIAKTSGHSIQLSQPELIYNEILNSLYDKI